MARDLDFKSRPRSKVVQTELPSGQPAAQPLLTAPPKRWWWLLLVVLVAVTLSYFYFQSLKPVATTTTPLNPEQTQVSSSENPVAAPIALVSVYDSGGGETAVTNLVASLNSHNYPAANLGQSQFQYDQTFIWYQPEYEKTVQDLVTLLGNRKVVLRQYQGSGPYKILIQLSK